MNRRIFFTTAAGAAVSLAQERAVRVGFVGVGNRGTGLLRNILTLPGVQVPAVGDINEANLQRALALVEKAGGKKPEAYTGVDDYRRLAERTDLDAVITATPWELHTKVCVAAMNARKYAATEVPAAITLEECWELVNTSERTGMPCMMLENVNYYRNVLMLLNMVEAGAFGEVVHCEGGYQHHIGKVRGPGGELTWRGMHSVRRNANLYPTHPIGPIAWWTSIHRGDRFALLTSMSSKAAGINHYVARRYGKDHPNAKRKYALGDLNVSLIRTANGVTITLNHDTNLPRPYDLGFKLQGTRGIYSGTLDKIFIEPEKVPEGRAVEEWQDLGPYYEKYEHALWRKDGKTASKYGHLGGDYFTLAQFVAAVRRKTQTPIDVYDSAAWSAITPLSETSVAKGSTPVDFPDFTKGKWKTKRPVQFFDV
jgi:predicted dehydrogenase